MPTADTSEFNIPDSYLVAIGRAIVNWSQLEGVVDFLLINLVGASVDDPRPHVLISHMSFQNKVDSLKTSSTLHRDINPEAHAKFIADIYPRITSLQQKRNSLVHSRWSVENGKVHQSKLTAHGQLKIEVKPVALNELEKMAEDIESLTGDIWAMVPQAEYLKSLPT